MLKYQICLCPLEDQFTRLCIDGDVFALVMTLSRVKTAGNLTDPGKIEQQIDDLFSTNQTIQNSDLYSLGLVNIHQFSRKIRDQSRVCIATSIRYLSNAIIYKIPKFCNMNSRIKTKIKF